MGPQPSAQTVAGAERSAEAGHSLGGNGSWDAADLLGAMRHATARLRADIDELNALNVFPVPDGDTGTNMLATMRAALEAAGEVPAPDRTVTVVAEALSRGALMGARGNSGVILSQLLRGLATALVGCDCVDGRIFAAALEEGCKASMKAVAQPVEGTMLTVTREASVAARKASQNGAKLEDVLDEVVRAAAEAVRRTPEQLPALAQAGVVDAGGRGVELLLRGALGYIRGEPVPAAPHDVLAFPSFVVEEEGGYGYETVFLVVSDNGQQLDPEAIRDHLDKIGDSVLVAGDDRAVKVHVHNERPDQVLAFGLSLGSLASVTIENLDRQTREMRLQGRQAPSDDPTIRALEPTRGPCVVAVAAGPGLASMFADLGAAGVVSGGQGANPSTGDLVEAIRATGGTQVIVLPNNPNVLLAARQAAGLLPDVHVSVVPTRNGAEGIAAMLTINPTDTLESNAERMEAARGSVQTMQVTAAVRDAAIGEHQVTRGQHIVLGGDEGLIAADPDRDTAVLLAMDRLNPGFELITLYTGEGVLHREAEVLAERIREAHPDAEVEIVEGGQPHYSFLISAE
jgi:uncharacterized protein